MASRLRNGVGMCSWLVLQGSVVAMGDIYCAQKVLLAVSAHSLLTSHLAVVECRAVRTKGRVTVNGMPFSKKEKRRVGFVLQVRPDA